MDNAYNYIKGYKIKKNKDNITISLNIKKEGIILDNLKITKNSDNEDTSLRFDVLSDIKTSSNAFKIGESSKKLKSRVEALGYTCK